jgi:hypothetical protein
MLLDHTILQLRTTGLAPERARALGHMGYLQWLGGLPGEASYQAEAMHAYTRAAPYLRDAPALRVFCELLVDSTRIPLRPLTLILPPKERRGGAKGRRAAL